ncbi:unnamed protein product [Schistosoma mattheei]|uniref:Uncharacterized protein n=1 Tax=Schistosoma mattheei TaxID=31246 RepID=A0AA85B8M3_9TREM|nr:unnamed protein product [Schistosoma mattheei]
MQSKSTIFCCVLLIGVGKKLAWSFGISSPKYYYIIENAKMRASERDFIDLGDMDDPHVAILQCSVPNKNYTYPSVLSSG